MSDEALLKMKQDDWLEACKEIDKLKSDLDLAIEALEWYMENCEVCAYELMGGDGAPSGYLPYDEKWTKAKETLARLKND